MYTKEISFDLYLFLSANSLIKEMCENQSGESFLCGLDNGLIIVLQKLETACRLAWVLFRVGWVSGVWG